MPGVLRSVIISNEGGGVLRRTISWVALLTIAGSF